MYSFRITLGIPQDAIYRLTELVNRNRELPTICLILGDMFRTMERMTWHRNVGHWQLSGTGSTGRWRWLQPNICINWLYCVQHYLEKISHKPISGLVLLGKRI